MNYAEMTDFEISKAVAEALPNIKRVLVPDSDEFKHHGVNCIKDGKWCWFNPCNSWADAGPIIQENKLSLCMDETESFWICTGFPSDGFPVVENHTNPLRAVAIVFLMIQESKNV